MVNRRYTGGQELAERGLLELLDHTGDIYAMAEVGSWQGGSACIFAPFVHRLHCIDIWDDWEGAYKGLYDEFINNTKSFASRIIVHRKPSLMAVNDFVDGELDMVYLDGLHDFGMVVSEIKAYTPKIRKGGYIAGHDWGRENEGISDVTQAVAHVFGKPDKTFCDSSWVVKL